MNLPPEVTIGVDIGGTFTDFVVSYPGRAQIDSFKIPSTPENPAQAVLVGLQRLFGKEERDQRPQINLVHGSTVATNALLERKGARTALVTTRGFADVIQIGRQNRPDLYDLLAGPPQSLVAPENRFEVDERVDSQGQVLVPLDINQLDDLESSLRAKQVESVAVCLLFSFLYPEHEQQITQALRAAGFLVSASCEVLPEFREFERTSTTVVNAYVSPVLDRYLSFLEQRLDPGTCLRVMQSNGGAITAETARKKGVNCILSGPAGGVIGCNHVAALALRKSVPVSTGDRLRVINFDMGGTSTDVSLIDEEPQLTSDSLISGCPIRVPMLAIHTIGAGGGSIARLDAGGALHVGPQSAGADPGPACYGKGSQPTVTDANLLLGRLAADYFLGGQMQLDTSRAYQAVEKLALEMQLTPQQAALGIIQVANAHMLRALRVISVERGNDPRDFTLLSFGGAGGLHAADLARGLGIPRLLVPPMASTLSAFGMLVADVVKDYSLTVMLAGDTPLAVIEKRLSELAEKGRQDVLAEGLPPERISVECYADLRYAGQSYELTVPFSSSLLADFHARHRQLYGYDRPSTPSEIVNLRVRLAGRVDPPELLPRDLAGPDPASALLEERLVYLDQGERQVPFFLWENLLPGNMLPGPAVVLRADTTILLGAGDRATVDPYSNLLVTIRRP